MGVPRGLQGHELREHLALARIAAVAVQSHGPPVLSHTSAARLWGLPAVDDGSVVHVIQRSSPNRSDAPDVRRHLHRLTDGDVVDLDGLRVTSLERTLLDCATSLRPSGGMIIADAALRLGADADSVLTRLGEMPRQRGVRRARTVLQLADDGAESPGESRLRFIALRAGFPVPQTQVRVPTSDGIFWADVGWPEVRVLAEYDGVAKYTAAGPASEAVTAERRREVLIEREGWRVARATSADTRRPEPFLAHLARLCHLDTRLTPRRWLA